MEVADMVRWSNDAYLSGQDNRAEGLESNSNHFMSLDLLITTAAALLVKAEGMCIFIAMSCSHARLENAQVTRIRSGKVVDV